MSGASVRQVCLSWVPTSAGNVPAKAVQAGEGIYVARAAHEGELLPGKAAPSHQYAFVAYAGQEIAIHQYDILVDTSLPCLGAGSGYGWAPCSGGNLPPNALVGGHTVNGEPLYIARALMNGEAVVGKVYRPHGCAYFPWGGAEHAKHDFEVLIVY